MSFKQKRILMKTFVESQFEVRYLYEFQTKANSYQDISWISVWSYVSLWVLNKSEFWWKHLLSFSFKWSKSASFKQNIIVMNPFFQSQFQVMWVYGFQTKANSYDHICCAPVWSYVSLWILNKSDFLLRHLLSLSLKFFTFMSFKPKQILMKTFVESQFQFM